MPKKQNISSLKNGFKELSSIQCFSLEITILTLSARMSTESPTPENGKSIPCGPVRLAWRGKPLGRLEPH
jgi:hypothetical protein